MTTQEACEKVFSELKSDLGYWMAWKANIAMAFKDEWQKTVDNGGLPATPDQIHKIANDAAEYFLINLTK